MNDDLTAATIACLRKHEAVLRKMLRDSKSTPPEDVENLYQRIVETLAVLQGIPALVREVESLSTLLTASLLRKLFPSRDKNGPTIN